MNIFKIFGGHSSPLTLRPNGRRHGWLPDALDQRDHAFTRTATVTADLLDMRTSPFMPGVYDQGQLGSCVGNGTEGVFEFAQRKNGLPDWLGSRLFIYYNGRFLEGTVSQDSGLQIRDGIKAVAKWGVAHENLWPYNIKKFKSKPTTAAYNDAKKHMAVKYESVDNSSVANIKHALNLGFPVVFGASLFNAFESDAVAANGMVPMPAAGEQPIGGHCMVIVGYTKDHWIVRNSWGSGWGDKGYCYFPFAYLTDTNLADDFWIVEVVK